LTHEKNFIKDVLERSKAARQSSTATPTSTGKGKKNNAATTAYFNPD
jgi:hypothetical protein